MDHNRPPSRAFGARPNRRASTHLTIDEEGRKPLFSKPSRETLEPPSPAQTIPGTNRFGYSPTNNNTSLNANPTGRPPSRAAVPRPSSSASQTPSINSNHSADIVSPGSRIPRPKSMIGIFSKGTGASVAEAWKLADENRVRTLERPRRVSPAIDASPSPAPRPYISRQTHDDAKTRRTLGKEAVDYSRARPLSRLSSDSLRDSYVARYGISPGSQTSLSSSGSFDRRIREYERQMSQSPSASREPDNLFGKTRTGSKIAETGHALTRRTSNGSLNGAQGLGRRASSSSLNGSQNLGRRTSYGGSSNSPRPGAFAKSHVPEGRIKELLQQDEMGIKRSVSTKTGQQSAADEPLPSIEASRLPQEPTPPTSRPTSTNPEMFSPEKSYAWQLDADFTAEDLQVSDSPRITMGGTAYSTVPNGRNPATTAYDAPEANGPYGRDSSMGITPRVGRSNNRIDEIRQREELANAELAEQQKRQLRTRNTKLQEIGEREAEVEDEMAKQSRAQLRSYYPTPDDLPISEDIEERPRAKNTKLDYIRTREAESLSKKAIASSRLEEIREQNSMSRSMSPEARRSGEFGRESAPARETAREDGATGGDGEHIPNTPVTVYHSYMASNDRNPHLTSPKETHKDLSSPKYARPQVAHTRTDSRDLLQRLARAASTSPAPEAQGQPEVAGQVKKLNNGNDEKTEKRDEDKISQQDHAGLQSHHPPERFEDKVSRRDYASLQSHQQVDSEDKIKNIMAPSEPKETVEEPVKEAPLRRRRSERRSEPEQPVPEQVPKASPPRLSLKEDAKALESALVEKADDPPPRPTDEPKPPEEERPKSAGKFAGRRQERRQRSTDSAHDGRKSMASSDGDPTDRIEQEMKLFAPVDNQSERGSVRATSVEPSTEDEDKNLFADETPRPVKVDPLSLPTPRVTGAYVETPATTRVEHVQEDIKPLTRPETTSTANDSRPPTRRGSRPPSRAGSFFKAGEAGPEASGDKEQWPQSTGTATTSTLRRRTRSTSRPRPPLTNSVKPPTVKDDILELQRRHQIEDSTLDDFEEMFNLQTLQSTTPPEIESILDEISMKREEVAAKPNLTKTERDQELEQYDRMSKTLKDGLLSIRTAKQGIERLEGQVSHAEGKQGDRATVGEGSEEQQSEKPSHHRHHPDHARDCPDCVRGTPVKEVSYLHLPVPSLYRRKPFRLTFVGLVFLIVSLWYAAESVMCEFYCRPATCSSTPCVWSSTDPTWGVAIPVKLDEWATNGWGRQVANQFSEEASDLWADAVDFVTGTDITTVDMNTLGFYEKRQHRRRLRKRGLLKPLAESSEDRAKWDAWHAARVASERVEHAREMGYDISEADESFGGDEML
ncbi:uncharacterized protein LY79DRAFT_557945 [Colletotrichum navitas]|uniref:Uncharacterized protein n=1 Tax=Colletotrichum navitas TaxID=681940 RepID=A0AAD8PX21_9PEZI|nr:uncharacterized protein LY79DRAFT_557945 [Colletotrichum navitas]KAK1585629.1 hypothetical protein LY79DRAFT_557945 [Colletotrichum navitas]